MTTVSLPNPTLYLFLISFLICSWNGVIAQSADCATANQMCPDQGATTYQASTNAGSAAPGNNYGCLATTPNPAWFFLSVSAAGSAVVFLSNSNNVDIDFALWGPFNSYNAAIGSCGSLGAPVSCSYSPNPNEIVVFPASSPGQVYLLMITNFSNLPTEISAIDPTGSNSIFSCAPPCRADGGLLTQGDISACFGDAQLNLRLFPTYGGPPPPANDFGYTHLIANSNGTVIAYNMGPNMTSTPPGDYVVCGLSYLLADAAFVATALGQNIYNFRAQLNSPTAIFCGDVSDDCVNVHIGPPVPPTFLPPVGLCLTECITGPDGNLICTPGSYEYTYQTPGGCDSVVNLIVFPKPPSSEIITLPVCAGGCVTVNGRQVCAPGPGVQILTASNGCDSILTIQLQEIPVHAEINPDPTPQLTCSVNTVTLNADSSTTSATLSWFNGSGQNLGNTRNLNVSAPGTISLIATVTQGQLICRDTDMVVVNGNALAPNLAVLDTPSICRGSTFDLRNLNILDSNNANGVLTFHTGLPTNPGNAINPVVNPSGNTTYYVRSSSGNCFDETSARIRVTPQPSISVGNVPALCAGDTLFFASLTIDDANNANGLISFHSGSPANASNQIANPYLVGTSNTTLYILSTSGSCFDETSLDIVVHPIPTSSFDIAGSACRGDSLLLSYTGSGSGNAVYSWNFNGGLAIPGTGAGPHLVSWNTVGPKTVTLQVTENGCSSNQFSRPVDVTAPLAVPIINCAEFLDSILFSWNDVPDATGYDVQVLSGQTGSDLGNNLWLFNNLSQGAQVTLEVTALSGNDCPNSTSTQTCIAQNCPDFLVRIDSIGPICLDQNASILPLSVSVQGATTQGILTWSGNGIADPSNGLFDPRLSGPGTHIISVRYQEGNCGETATLPVIVHPHPTANFQSDQQICMTEMANLTYTGSAGSNADYRWNFGNGLPNPASGQGPFEVSWNVPGQQAVSLVVIENGCASDPFFQNIQVDPPLEPLQINCQPSLDAILFNWNLVNQATDYDVFVNGTLASNQSNRDFNITGLQPGDNVSIRVVANSSNACPDVQASLSCTAQDCPDFVLDFQNLDPICLDANAQLVQLGATIQGGNGNGQLIWSGPGIVDSIAGIFDPALQGPGQFFINATYLEGNCSTSGVLTLTILPQPDAFFNADSPVCAGDISVLEYQGNAGINATFTWSFDNGTANPGTGRDPQLVSWDTAGNKNVSLIVEENGCISNQVNQTIQVDPPLSRPQITCTVTNSSIDFNWPLVPGASDYQIILDGDTIGRQIGGSYALTGLIPATNATIQVLAISQNSCPNVSASRTCSTEDCPPVSAQISALSNTVCEGDTAYLLLSLNAGSNDPFDLVWSNGIMTDTLRGVSNGFTWPVVPATSSVFMLTRLINRNFPSCDYPLVSEVAIEVRQPLNAGMPGIPLTLCATTDTLIFLEDMLSGNDAGGFWNETSTSPSLGNSFNNQAGTFSTAIQQVGTYHFQYTVTNPPCPADDATVTIHLSAPPVTGFFKGTPEICANEPTLIRLFDLLENEDPGGAWAEISTDPSTGNAFNALDAAFYTANQLPGTYAFEYTVNGQAPCLAESAVVTVKILPPPTAIAADQPTYYLDCAQTMVTIGSNGNPVGNQIFYEWTSPTGIPAGNTIFLEATEPGTYLFSVLDTLTGCQATDSALVERRITQPFPYLTIAPVSCFGDNDGKILVDSVTGGMPPFLFSLNGGPFSTASIFENLSPAVYDLTVEDAYGCTQTITINIEQPVDMVVDLILYIDPDGVVNLGDSIELFANINISPDEVDSVLWSPPGLFNHCDTCLRQMVSPLENTTFAVTVISNDGCMASDEYAYRLKKVRPVYIPTGFSPNDDGINDAFRIYPGAGVARVKSFLIFDRWGEMVHEFYDFDPNDPAHGWNGTLRGQPMNSGVFTYFAEILFIDGYSDTYKGDVTLVK